MSKYLTILVFTFAGLSGCNNTDDVATQEADKVDAEKTTKKAVEQNSPFSRQLNALETAKQVGDAAQKTIDLNQQKLDYNRP